MARPLILIIDDDKVLRDMYAERLKLEDFRVATAGDGQEGLKKTQTLKPDLILLDIMLPKLNGYQVARKLKEDSSTNRIPIFFLTALVTEAERKKALALQAGKDFLVKSEVMPAEIVAKIRRAIR